MFRYLFEDQPQNCNHPTSSNKKLENSRALIYKLECEIEWTCRIFYLSWTTCIVWITVVNLSKRQNWTGESEVKGRWEKYPSKILGSFPFILTLNQKWRKYITKLDGDGVLLSILTILSNHFQLLEDNTLLPCLENLLFLFVKLGISTHSMHQWAYTWLLVFGTIFLDDTTGSSGNDWSSS